VTHSDGARPAVPRVATENTVDVVVPTFDARAMVIDCVARVLEDAAVSQVIVVDDASRDGTEQALREHFADRVSIVGLAGHRGLAHALNAGAKLGESEFVLFLNNDVLAVDGAVGALSAALIEAPNAASSGGRLVDPDTRRTQAGYQPRDIPGLAALLVRVCGLEGRWPSNPWTGRHLTAPMDDRGVQPTDRQLAGSCLMIRRAALEAVGGWDERYWFWYEDVDLALRLRSCGAALYVPEAIFEHLGGASTSSWPPYEQHLRRYHGTMVYVQRHLSPARQRVFGAFMAAACVPRIVRARNDPPARAAYATLLRNAASIMLLDDVIEPNFALGRPASSELPAG
jgi:N-acetylglucosaminyl-diphospho-decaprenol L-rhamnosyltransferase